MKIEKIRILPVNFHLQNTFRTALGQKNLTRNLAVIAESEGLQGYGEASSSLAMPEASPEAMSLQLREMSKVVIGTPVSLWEETARGLYPKFGAGPTALAALECALLDLYCRSRKMPQARYFGKKKAVVETHYTVSALGPAACAALLKKKTREGFKKFKVKVTGRNGAQDLQRVRLAHGASKTPVIVDANQGWTPKSCLQFAEKIQAGGIGVSLIEQPLDKRDIRGLAFLNKRCPIPIAVDESFRNFKQARALVEAGAGDVFNVKLAKIGLLESLKIARYLKKAGKRLMIGCMMESRAGLSASVQWACGTGVFDFVDLDSFLLLRKASIEPGFKNKGPLLSLA